MNAIPEKLPLSQGQIALRIIGAILLFVCALMVILGSTVLAEQLRGPRFILYWTTCMILTLAAIIIALWDMLLVRRALKRTSRELFEREFMSGDIGNRLRSDQED